MKINLQSLYSFYRNAIRNPKYRNWIILGTLVYVLSPFDISPDFFPLAGQIDDFFLLSIMLTEVSQMVLTGLKNKKEKNNQSTENFTSKTVDVDAVSLD
ncbi:YkvA family protein [Geminocystis herdmanii]|uniref:YkvA family protein n=1 Tax=Geminocystis herdmanii TaxID=669359 RepID=UPI000345D2AB|nr:YkvA family protein [Geminocystis herdmanii]